MTPASALRCAAVQLQAVLGDVAANLEACEDAVVRAAREGARVVVLPEFFTSGVAFRPEVATAAQPLDGYAVRALQQWARRHDILLSGSLLLRDDDGHVRNAQLLVDRTGIVGRHDKDLPTMWEHALYVGGRDDGLQQVRVADEAMHVGTALCWELTRRRTVDRLAGRVDLVLAGSGWWSVPRWRPHRAFDAWEQINGRRARDAPAVFARFVGAPVVHAAHVGRLVCALPGMPGRYRGRYEGGTGVWDAAGQAVAVLPPVDSGPGTARPLVVDVPSGRREPESRPASYWVTPPGPVPRVAWHWQRAVGRAHYRRHVQAAYGESGSPA